MTAAEWHAEFQRLDHFRISADAKREGIEFEWYAQLKHHHVDAVSYGVSQLIGQAKDNFLPGLGLLKDFIQQRFSRYDRTPGKCGTCHGSGWIDAPPFQANGLIYANTVRRCSDCGIPEPTIEEHSRRHPISELQAHEYAAGRFGRDQMPPRLEAKHPDKPGNPELKKAIGALIDRLMRQEVA